ncbi:hypothetical protein ABPG77_004012 [Micractinium sp. CCAP 211/92]
MASRPAVAAVAAPLPPTLPRQQEVQPVVPPRTTTGGGSKEDPWKDPRWAGKKWTVYRGVAYDLTAFMDRHPAGASLLRLAIGRDCTALFESYHLRPEVAVARLQRLPQLKDFPVDAVPRSPYPNDSPIYNAIRDRVRNELFGGQEHGAHRTGSEGAAAVILGYAAASYLLYAAAPGPLSGFLLGLGGAWIGLTVQHCGNHGAMSTKEWVNDALGLCDDLIGGSSLTWRYHHQVSHHIHCNDEALDEDVLSSFPLLRFDARLPRRWYHRYQHIYMWATFPLLQLVFQIGDWQALLANRTAGATMYGATTAERATVVLGKLAHYGLLLGLPWALHGSEPALWGAAAYAVTQSIVLASTFAVSHNVPESKPLGEGPTTDNLLTELAARDWGMQQILTSADWGGVVGNFFTGGLNLQVEHHLFPAISFCHYPAIAEIVKDECAKRGVPYARYDTLPEILGRFVLYMKEVGVAEQLPSTSSMGSADLARL